MEKNTEIKGIPASPGIAIGSAFVYSEPTFAPELRIVSRKRVEHEINRFKKAVKTSREYLQNIREETEKNYGESFAEVIETQISILDDEIFLNEVEQLIRERQYDAAYATFKIFRSKKEHFLRLSDDYFRDRAFDIQNLKRLILKNLIGRQHALKLEDNSIIVAEDLSPADAIRFHHKHIIGFCTNYGGKNSHTAIVARSLGVPAVVGTEIITSIVKPHNQLILDGNGGLIIVNPDEATLKSYEQKQKQFLLVEKELLEKAVETAVTRDGHHIKVAANIEFIEELEQVTASGAEGIGLYRTEGLFLGENGLPSEDVQTEIYSRIAEAMKPQTVIIRTLDVGGDKLLPELVGLPERNPFLGWRAIRFCLDHKEFFIPQLKAILRANLHGNLHILIPMVSSIEEIHQFKEILEEAIKILESEGKPFNADLKIGTMIEIPSAALMAEHFVKEVDFFSIGTNDLIQYTLAVDRANEKIARLYNHFHPAVIQLIKRVIDVGKQAGILVSMCGEMAGDPVAVPLLLGMGLNHLSASHFLIPEVKNTIRHLSLDQCQELYQQVVQLHTAKDIQKVCEDFYGKLFTFPANLSSNTNNKFIKI
ncbi:MAG: phosphoenolpyruvate--protein phosphotransferase [Calditrichia bacterium]